jgi:peptidoglycan/xylan/chitin deacetylase (PgdA/CDA1 family)
MTAFGGLARLALRPRATASATRRLAAARGVGQVLVYHRVRPRPPAWYEVVPCVTTRRFEEHLEVLGETADVVSLADLVAGRPSRRPRVALTFDDDEPDHETHVLPALLRHGMPATFFLSGRSLHGLGPYWWQPLEQAVRRRGVAAVGVDLGVADAESATDLALACEHDASTRARAAQLDVDGGSTLGADGIVALARAGLDVSFHTLEHRVLTQLSDTEVAHDVSAGAAALAELTGTRPRWFAYPHGKADARVAASVRAAGFDGAWTGRPVAHLPTQDRYLLGRWEPRALPGARFERQLGVRLLDGLVRPAGSAR